MRKACLDDIEFFHSRFQPLTHSWGFQPWPSPSSSVPANNSTHSLIHTPYPHSPPPPLHLNAELHSRKGCLFMTHQKRTRSNIKENCWSFLGSGLEEKGVGWGEGAGMGRILFVFCFFSPPSPIFYLSLSPTHLSSFLSAVPSASRLFNTFQILTCRRPPRKAARLLVEFGGKGCGSRKGLLT